MQAPHLSKIQLSVILLLTALIFNIRDVPLMAQAPEYISLQGVATDTDGNPLTGFHSITVRIYADSVEVYSQTEAGDTGDGRFDFHVGPVDDVVFGEPLLLGITIDSDPEMPRIELESVPFALGLRGLRVQNDVSGHHPPNLIGGKWDNSVAEGTWGATIAGGGGTDLGSPPTDPNRVEGFWGTVGGGGGNTAGAPAALYATVAGGRNNTADNGYATVSGGYDNMASGVSSTVCGGNQNNATGYLSTVVGGLHNTASGAQSLAAGSWSNASFDGSFVWQDATASVVDHQLSPFHANMFRARASGGFYFQTAAATAPAPQPLSIGAVLASGEGTWAALSSRDLKEEFEAVDGGDILRKLTDLDIQKWQYLGQEGEIRHIGPMSQDFHAAFGVGIDDEHISTIDADGVALAAIQGLYELVKEQQTLIEGQQVEIERLRELVEGE